LTAILSIIHN